MIENEIYNNDGHGIEVREGSKGVSEKNINYLQLLVRINNN